MVFLANDRENNTKRQYDTIRAVGSYGDCRNFCIEV